MIFSVSCLVQSVLTTRAITISAGIMAGTIINITCTITCTISDIMPKLFGWYMIATSGSEKRYNLSTRVNMEQVIRLGGLDM